MVQRRSFVVGALACAAAGSGAWAGDALDRPARASALADRRLVTGIALAGERIVAVGQRGHIVHSVDGGRHWTQATVPVSVDLTAVSFVDASAGYATGHDGVVLGTRDGGLNWTLLLDGRRTNALVLAHQQRRVQARDVSDHDRRLLEEAMRNVESGPDKPFLDVAFEDAERGFVVGAFGLAMRTIDGGKKWEPWLDRIDNPRLLNLYAIRAAGDQVYIVGESGLMLKLDRAAGRFKAVASPYKGSLFGVAPTSAGVLAFGMRGHAFLSRDGGESWAQVETGLGASIVSGAVGAKGTVVIADQGGSTALSTDGGRSFVPAGMASRGALAAVALAGTSTLVLGGPRGLRTIDLLTKDS